MNISGAWAAMDDPNEKLNVEEEHKTWPWNIVLMVLYGNFSEGIIKIKLINSREYFMIIKNI